MESRGPYVTGAKKNKRTRVDPIPLKVLDIDRYGPMYGY